MAHISHPKSSPGDFLWTAPKKVGKPRALNEAQCRAVREWIDARRRVASPKKMAASLGICTSTLNNYVREIIDAEVKAQ